MKQLLYLFLLCMVFSTHLFSTVRRGNIFQQLMFLSGVPIHEQFYNLVVRVFLINSFIHPSTNCTHTIYCSRTEYCSEICKPGTVTTTSWHQFASRTQSSLSTLSSFCEHQSIGTHNSAITAAYGYGVEDTFYSVILSASYLQFNQVRTLSQFYSIIDQLNMGVRQIELDIHYFHNHLRISHCGFSVGLINYLFHAMERTLRYFNFMYDTETIGCMPSFNGIPTEDQLLLEPIIDEILHWLKSPRNRHEFITLYLDLSKNLQRWNKERDLISLLESRFGSLLIPSDSNNSLWENILSNHRVMIVTRHPLHSQSLFTTRTKQTCWWQESDIKTFCLPDGTVKKENEHLAGKTNYTNPFYLRIVTNQLRYGPLSKDFLPLPSPVNFSPKNTYDLYKLGVNSLATDYLSNEQIQQHFWLWDQQLNITNIQLNYHRYCVLMNSKETWEIVPCSEKHPVLCQHELNHEKYSIGETIQSPHHSIPCLHGDCQYSVNKTLCPPGYSFRPPITLRQQTIARGILRENQTVWIGFRLEEYYFW